MISSQSAGRLAALLLVTTCLSPLPFAVRPALATGGEGGGPGGGTPGSPGGADSLTGAGENGQDVGSSWGGGGGGAGTTGGTGGNNTGGAGLGGQSAGQAGQPGRDGDISVSGGGGGGGGAHGAVIVNSGELGSRAGGAGGLGGQGTLNGPDTGGGGGGGAGGYGAVINTQGNFTSSGNIAGGAGGDGGDGIGTSGSGGTGGIGLAFTNSGSGSTLINTGTITGGSGGVGGADTGGGAGVAGAGGAGITGSNLTIVNSGSIAGGMSGDGVTQANAITFTSGVNMLELHATSTISGNVVAVLGGNDTLRLGGSGNGTFDMSQVGSVGQYQNFATFEKTGTGLWSLSGMPGQGQATPWTITQGTLAITSGDSLGMQGETLTLNGGTLQLAPGFFGGFNHPIVITAGGGGIDTNGNNLVLGSAITGDGGLTKNGAGILNFQTAMAYTGGTTINAGTLFLDSVGGSLPAGGALTMNGGTFDMSEIAVGQTVGALSGTGGRIELGPNTLTTGSNVNTTFAGVIAGTGSLVKNGSGILALTGSSTYSGGTTINGGLINFNAANNFGTGPITLNGGGLQWAAGTTTDISPQLALGAAGGILDTNGNNVTLAAAIGGPGGLTKQGSGVLNLAGTNGYLGPTSVVAGTLAVNGSVTSTVTVGPGGTLGGTGSIFGGTMIQGTLAPGNSIGTLTISGNFTQAAGSTYQVEVNAAGQGDRVNVGGTATIQGGTVQVLAQPGNYGQSTTYTIVNATGGVSGTYSGVTSNFAFLTPTLTYDPNNVFLTLALLPSGGGNSGSGGGFMMSAYTPNQKAVGAALNQSFAGATGNFATVINALAGLTAFQGPAALNAISGEQYADFGTMNVNNSAMFMNAVGQQMAVARGAAAPTGQRASLAQACEVAACDGMSPFSVWGTGLGGFGSVAGDYNASTATYNYFGAAVGADYRFDPRFLVGLATAYTSGSLWVNSFPGKGWTNSVAVAAYGSFTPMGDKGGFYADLLGGYGWFSNQLQRQISISGLQPLTATGSTNANQAMGQIETGYRIGVFAPAGATVAPFARLQGSSVTQNGFTENGAQALNLQVQQQTTSSLRTLFGADLSAAVPLGTDRSFDIGLRLGWQHEFASTARPITASLVGAPLTAFTVYGATPQRDAAVMSLRGSTGIAAGTQLYLRYDGEVGGGTDNHAFNLGVRVSW